MTEHKDFKSLVRARMRSTGESYTVARAALLIMVPIDASLARPGQQRRELPA